MKRFHVHVAVSDIADSIRFYSQVFGTGPAVSKPDYAKWMLDDPRINFAISMRGSGRTGIDHLGMQVDSDGELKAMRAQLASADAALVEENAIDCCYAKSDKYWVTDPQGIAWETWHSLGTVSMYGDGDLAARPAGATSCAPAAAAVVDARPERAARCAPDAATVVDARPERAACSAPAALTPDVDPRPAGGTCCSPAATADGEPARSRGGCCA